MLAFQFSRISFVKASKYVFLVSTQKQTKRSDVCFSWTSSPTFDEPIQFSWSQTQSQQSYKIKACQATIDRKLKIVGFAVVDKKDFTKSQAQTLQIDTNSRQTLVYDNDLQLKQVVQGKDVIVGRFHLQVKRVEKQVENKHQKKSHMGKESKVKQTDNNQEVNNNQNGHKSLQGSMVNSRVNQLANKSYVNSARLPELNKESHRLAQSGLGQQSIKSNKLAQSRLGEQKMKSPGDRYGQQQYGDFDSQLQMKSNESQQQAQNDCQIRFFIHGGTNFYLGSSFSVQLLWGQKYCQTYYIKDKIQPRWAQSLTLIGNSQQSVTLNVVDQGKNILQWTKFSLKNIRKIYPYHLRLLFREQYMGDRPVLYFSMLREDLPRYSILDKQVKLVINYEGQHIRDPLQYLVIQTKTQLELPKFFQIDLRKYSSFDQVNKFIECLQIGDYNWIDFIPLQTGKKSLVLFKSQLNKQLNLFLVSIRNWNLLFSEQKKQKKLPSVSVVQSRPNFHNILKKIYYYQQVHAIGNQTQIYSENNLAEDTIKDHNVWRTMTKNYILRNNLLNTSIENLQVLSGQITTKGEQLIKLKKILNQVKTINNSLKQKQKSTIITDLKTRKQRLQASNFKATDIQMMLYQKQTQLQFKKKRNNQMGLRMDSLNAIQEDTTEIDKQIVRNSKDILEQQQKVKLLLLIRRRIPEQKQLIYRLQSVFEKNQVDREMNQLLSRETEKLTSIRRRKRVDLENVYKLLRHKNSQENNLKSKVEAAEQQLIKLNQFYAKLTGL